MKTYLVIESKNVLGKVAYIETVTESDNLLRYSNDVLSVSAYTIKKEAQKQVDFLNELYREELK